MKASAFQLQARQTFGNRSQGVNVYGSADGVDWTKLTTKETTNTNKLETLPVDPTRTDTSYRFLKAQVDNAGQVTDPNFPPIFSLAEFHIQGTRVEAVNRVTTAHIASSNTVPTLATNGDTVTVTFTTSEAVTGVNGAIAGAPATISGSGTEWTASAAVPATVASGKPASFSIGYTTAGGQTADPLAATSDDSTVFLSNSAGLVADVPKIVTPVSASGEVETSKRADVQKLFDGDARTFSDVGPVGGQYYVTLDFGAGGSIALDRAELLVRQDTWGTSRASQLHFEGSNDQQTWTTLTNNAQSTLDWQSLALRPGTKPAPYRYLKIANDNWVNIAELRLFGDRTAPPATAIATASIASSNSDTGRATKGDTVTVSFTTSEAITGLRGSINGQDAAVKGSGQTWTAAAVVAADTTPGQRASFSISYAGPNGETRQPLTTTTDGSSVLLTSNDGLISDIRTRVSPVSPTGTPETSKQVYVDRIFDGNPANLLRCRTGRREGVDHPRPWRRPCTHTAAR